MIYKKTLLLIDGHVHIYPHYDLSKAVQEGMNNLKAASENIIERSNPDEYFLIWLLTERSDCNFFDTLVMYPGRFKTKDFKLIPVPEKEAVVIEQAGQPVLYILAGRQIVSREGLEILSLISTQYIKDRKRTIDDVIKAVNESGGIAGLNWAPGKWFFSRGKVVRRVLEEYSPEKLVLGDTPLRNTLWPMPKLMKDAKVRGFKVIAGSDPLPFDREEKYLGSYGFSITGEFNAARPVESVRSLLKQKGNNITLIGKRNNFITFCRRQYKIMSEKKKPKIKLEEKF
ncbi:MAG: hypothetical protein AB1638_02585 [Nitrospirota bacterium]